MFSLESKSAAMGVFSWGLKNEFETAMVNEPTVFEPWKFYCVLFTVARLQDSDGNKIAHLQYGSRTVPPEMSGPWIMYT